jgi:hypothetical protein
MQQEILDRRLIQAEHARTANVAAARLKHQAVLAQVVGVNAHVHLFFISISFDGAFLQPSPDKDTVSIPSGDEDSAGLNLPTIPNIHRLSSE